MRPVGPDQVARLHRLLTAVTREGGAHTVVVLVDAGDSQTTLDGHAAQCQFVAQNPLGGVLRDGDEAERHVGGNGEVDLADVLAVDVEDLSVHLDGRVQYACHDAHRFEHFERTGLNANGFRILWWFSKWVDDAAVDAAPGQLDGRGEADGAGAGDEDVRIHPLIMLPSWATTLRRSTPDT